MHDVCIRVHIPYIKYMLFHAHFMGLSVIASFMRYLFEITSVYRQIFTSLGKWTSRKYGRYNLVSFMIEHSDFSGSVIVY